MGLIDSNTFVTAATAAPLPNKPCTQVWVHNNDGTNAVLVGNATAQNYTLGPGQALEVRTGNRNQVWVKAAAGTPTVSFLST